MYMPGRLRTASSPSRMVIDAAPYSSWAFFFWAATIRILSSGVACMRLSRRRGSHTTVP
ncbi:Uncharacterised protein [Mycobacterium tuberculosis]|nr:Uncharacterised protein [Mycobacterium tuberculosis]